MTESLLRADSPTPELPAVVEEEASLAVELELELYAAAPSAWILFAPSMAGPLTASAVWD